MRIDREALKERISGSLYALSREDGRTPISEYQADEHAQDAIAVIEPILSAAEKLKLSADIMKNRLERFGNWDDGCFYYNRTSATELETPLLDLIEAIAAFDAAPQPGADT